MIWLAVSLAVLVPSALVAGYFVGRRENLTVLDASRQVADQTRFIVEMANDRAEQTRVLKDVSVRLDDHARGINQLGDLQREAIDTTRQVLGLERISERRAAPGRIDPDAPQVGE